MNFVYSLNDKIGRFLPVILNFIFKNNPEEYIYIYILEVYNDKLSQETKNHIQKTLDNYKNKYIKYIEITKDDISKLEGIPKYNGHYFAHIRLLIPEKLHFLDRVFMMPPNVIVNKNLKSLFEMDMKGKCIYGTLDNSEPEVLKKIFFYIERSLVNYSNEVSLWDINLINRKRLGTNYLLSVYSKYNNYINGADEQVVMLAYQDEFIADEPFSVKFNVNTPYDFYNLDYLKIMKDAYFIVLNKPWIFPKNYSSFNELFYIEITKTYNSHLLKEIPSLFQFKKQVFKYKQLQLLLPKFLGRIYYKNRYKDTFEFVGRAIGEYKK